MIVRQIVNSVFNSCSYVIAQGDQSWLVDCGDVDRILPNICGNLKGVLLTHAHFDHIYGLNNLMAVFPGVPIYTNAAGKDGLLHEKLNFSKYHGDPFVLDDLISVKLVSDGQSLNLFKDVDIVAVSTPGHSPDCVTWVMDEAIFTGDSYIPGVKTVTNLPQSDKVLARLSEAAIKEMIGQRTVYPGHATENEL